MLYYLLEKKNESMENSRTVEPQLAPKKSHFESSVLPSSLGILPVVEMRADSRLIQTPRNVLLNTDENFSFNSFPSPPLKSSTACATLGYIATWIPCYSLCFFLPFL